MNILFLTICWPDEERSNIYTDLIHEFRDQGHNMFVVSNNPRRSGKPDSYKKEDGINVLRVKTGNISKTNYFEKSLSLLLLNYQFKKKINEYLKNETFDLIIFNTPPITMSGLLGDLKRSYNCKVYLLLKDIWPYGFADLGAIKEGGIVWKYFRRHEKKIYSIADQIGCMSPKNVSFILDKNPQLNPEKVEVCPNAIRVPSHFIPANPKVKESYGIPEDATVFLFSGNLGKGHGLEFLIKSIEALDGYDKAFFLIGGAGTHFNKIKSAFSKSEPRNAFLYSYLPEKEFEQILGISDVGLILLDSSYTYPQFPSRLLAYLKAKMAVLCAVNSETDIGEIVEAADAGISTLHGNSDEFIKAVKQLSKDKKKIKAMGENGYQLLKNRFSVEQAYRTIINHF